MKIEHNEKFVVSSGIISEDGFEIELKHCGFSKTSVRSSRKPLKLHLNWIIYSLVEWIIPRLVDGQFFLLMILIPILIGGDEQFFFEIQLHKRNACTTSVNTF